MADGITSLNSISWGTSTGGSAVSAESTLSLGVDRSDTRIPPDTSHLWGAALNNAKNLLIAMSQTFKSGTRLGVATQSASPFAANEQGLWVDNSGVLRYSFGGSSSTLFSAAFAAKGDLISYTGAATAIQSVGADGTVLTADSTQPNGLRWGSAGVSWPLQNGTSGNTYNSAVTDSGSAVGHKFTTTNTFATDGDFVAQFQSPSGTNWFTIGRASSQNAFTFNGNTTATGAGPVFVVSATSNAGVTLDATGGGGRKYTTYSTTGGLWLLADLTASANRWQMDSNGALAPFADNTVNLGLPSTNRIGGVYAVRTEALRFTSPRQTPTIAATMTIDPANGDWVRLLLSATTITSMTISPGLDGEIMTIALIQDATGTRTVPSTWTNVGFSGTFAQTTTANKRDHYTFRYDGGAAKWWEIARSLNA